MDCSTIEGKIRYVMEKHPDAVSIDQIALLVWKTFYAHLFVDLSVKTVRMISAVDVLKLPSREQIRDAKRRALSPAREKVAAEGKPPWYSNMP